MCMNKFWVELLNFSDIYFREESLVKDKFKDCGIPSHFQMQEEEQSLRNCLEMFLRIFPCKLFSKFLINYSHWKKCS